MSPYLRQIRSFVRREGRMTNSQKLAIEKHWPVYGLNFQPEKINLENLFGRHAKTIIDIGCGSGESTFHFARQHPENNYLAVEVHRPGIGGLLKQIADSGIQNIRVLNHDVTEILQFMILSQSIDQVFIFFPDPWPKKRHHKRRLINPKFLKLLGNCLKDNSRISIATDWEDYANHICTVMDTVPGYFNLSGTNQFILRPHWRPITRFERRGLALNHQVYDFLFGFRPQVA